MGDVELLAPAGSFETALSAFEAGADAVYLGLSAFSARAQAVNFSTDELADLLSFSRARKRKVYVTFNTLLEDVDMPEAVGKLALLAELGPDALIVQDLGVARIVKRHFPSLALHASTQMVAHNLEGVLAMRDLGFDRVVLARELPISDIRSIASRCGCEIEVFVHGALCYSLSGLCLFSAMERNRSGNRGRCAYCCRLSYEDGGGRRALPFSMKDLRLDDHLDALREAGVASLKIEGRMKSSLYVASVVRRYRELLDSGTSSTTREDLETVFSRSTTHLYADGWRQAPESVIDPCKLGHQGTAVGIVKGIAKDRDGRSWIRFHTSRALERYDGLQFVAASGSPLADETRPLGMGIGEMRIAISRKPVFEVPAGSDVEIEVTDLDLLDALAAATSAKPRRIVEVRCAMSNAVKRRFPVPSFRASDYPGVGRIDVDVCIRNDGVKVSSCGETVFRPLPFAQKSDHPEQTEAAVRKYMGKLGGTGWSLGTLTVEDAEGILAPASVLNGLRRELVERLDAAKMRRRDAKVASVVACLHGCCDHKLAEDVQAVPFRTVKIRLDQTVPEGGWGETVVAIGHDGDVPDFAGNVRLALPIFTKEGDCGRMRTRVKALIRAGFLKWEVADLAGLRMIKALGIEDVTSDWSLYALNAQAAHILAELGVKRCVMSPESNANADLSSFPILTERLERQSTPLFISVTKPAVGDPSVLRESSGGEFTAFPLDGLWVTTRTSPRVFHVPSGCASRLDLSWDPVAVPELAPA